MNKKGKNTNKFLWVIWLILGGFLVRIFFFIFKRKHDIKENFDDFIEEEKEEVEELVDGKESFKKYCNDSFCLFKNYFIPNSGNDHKPKILHSRSLLIIAIALILIKSVVTGYLFFIYPNQARMSEIIISRMLELTNSSRVANDLSPVKINSVLNSSAKLKAEDMIANNYFAHHSPDGKKPWDWIDRSTYPYLFVGENLAMNFSSADSAHNALMLSPSHKENILNNRFSDIGLAVVSGEIDGEKTNVLVELFATQKELEIAIVSKEEEPEDAILEPDIPNEIDILSSQNIEQDPEIEIFVGDPGPRDIPQEIPEDDIISNPTDTIENEFVLDEAVDNNQSTTTNAIGDIKDEANEIADIQKVSPNEELEFSPNLEITYFNEEDTQNLSAAVTLVKVSQFIYVAVLILLIISLIVNILVRITIQHKPVIIQTIILIIFIAGLISIHFHFLEKILGSIAII